MMYLTGWIALMGAGMLLGLTGGGGSILTVPILVYLLHINPNIATSYSLFVVGFSSLAGMAQHYRQGSVNVRVAIAFIIPSLASLIITRQFLIPIIPEHIFIGNGYLGKSAVIMLLLALLMVYTGMATVLNKKSMPAPESAVNYKLLLLIAVSEGFISGMSGAGGGFIIIPALIILFKLPAKTAVGTSLAIISLKSLPGFFAEAGNGSIQWKQLLVITAFSTAGIIAGNKLGNYIHAESFKKISGWFVVIVGVAIIIKELSHTN